MTRVRYLKDMGAVGASLYVTRLFYLVRGLVTARLLGPADYGVWGALGIILNYSNLAPLGSAEAIGREIPYYTQSGDEERVRKTKELAFSFNLYASLIVSIGIAIFAASRRAQLESVYYYGLYVVAASMTLQQLYFFYGIVLRAEKKFVLRSKIEIVYAAFNVPTTILLVALFGIWGLFSAFLVNLGLIVVFLVVRFPIKPQLKLPGGPLLDLMRIGFPIYLMGLVYTVFASVDRLVIVKYLTSSDMGYYTIALALMTVLGEVPIIVAQVMSPSLIEHYSRAKSLDRVLPYVQIPTMAIAFCFPMILVLAIFGFEFLVTYVLPRFRPGFTAVEILVLGSYFTGVLRGPSSFLLAVRRQMAAVGIYAFAIGVAVTLNLAFVKAGFGLNGIALATALAYFILLLMYVTYVYSFFLGRRLWSYLRVYAGLALPFTFSVAIYLLLRNALPLEGGAPFKDGLRILLRSAVYVLVVSPSIFYFLKRYGIWHEALHVVRTGLSKVGIPSWPGGK